MSYNRNPCFSQGFKFWMKSFCWSDWPLPACEFAGWSGLAQCAWRGCSFWRGFWSSVGRRLPPPRGLLWCACSAPWCWRYPRRTGGTSENGRNCLHCSSSFSSSFPETSETKFYKLPAARFNLKYLIFLKNNSSYIFKNHPKIQKNENCEKFMTFMEIREIDGNYWKFGNCKMSQSNFKRQKMKLPWT